MKIPGISNFISKVADYTRPRPTTGGDSQSASPVSAAISGGYTSFISTQNPMAGLGGAAGGYIGIKVGEKTESFSKAALASIATGATASVAAAAAFTGIKALIAGASIGINPVGTALVATLGGLSGFSGTLHGSCSGDVKDNGITGMLTGSIVGGMTGNPLLTVAGSLSGAISGLFESKAGKILAGIGSGAALGAATGAITGPATAAVGAVAGAITGGIASIAGKTLGQIQRNISEDLQNKVSSKLRKHTKKLGVKGRTALGALGGAVSSLPMALLFGAIGGLPLGALAIAVGGVATGIRVNKILRRRKKAGEYSDTVRGFLLKDHSKEQLDRTPPEVIEGLSMAFAGKYKNKKDFEKLSREEFRKDVMEFQVQENKV